MKPTPSTLATLTAIVLSGLSQAWAQSAASTRYDPETRRLHIPSVDVGDSTFEDVVLADQGGYLFTLESARERKPSGGGTARFDPVTGVLSLPAVQLGSSTYVDVTLADLGGLRFSLRGASEFPSTTRDEITAFLAAFDDLWATAVPATGAQRLSLSDSCYLHDGRTRDRLVADIDADAAQTAARDSYRIGQRSSAVQILGERKSVNADGSARHEVDIQYDLLYADGTQASGVRATLISGSSEGTPDCAQAQSAPQWRFWGNRQKVQALVRSRNLRDERYSVNTGVALSPAVSYRRDLQWQVSDPMGHSTYVIVTGPGPAGVVAGAPVEFSLKLISPRLLATAPELAGKAGNFRNWLPDDAFRFCRSALSGVPVAALADCTGQGASANDWGLSTASPDATADANFASLGFVAGGTYRFDVFDDDGWKTVNGHLGRTPVARYFATLQQLPYNFVDLAGSSASTDLFPRLSVSGQTITQVQANFKSAAPAPLATTWTLPGTLPDGEAFGLVTGWEYFQGPAATNIGTIFNPAYRYLSYIHPGSQSAAADWPVAATPTDISAKTYVEYLLQYSDRDGRQINSRLSFQ